ncbi:hypothetical protein E2C01_086612 [Portunus trituberculatus]|uniref:Secreted protein n=1 Tax=Portunus trituberculatus TaxID=210409 RepID=A0A5B7JDY1_PORTR|nr:hypothetical protein [Portunus trituberculatus]
MSMLPQISTLGSLLCSGLVYSPAGEGGKKEPAPVPVTSDRTTTTTTTTAPLLLFWRTPPASR